MIYFHLYGIKEIEYIAYDLTSVMSQVVKLQQNIYQGYKAKKI